MNIPAARAADAEVTGVDVAGVDVAGVDVTVPRRLRADAARNRQRLIDAAAEVFAARGMDATLDDIAHHAGVNVATAYRHFANKHELAREFLRQCIDRAAAVAEEAAADPDPWTGLTSFLERSLDMIASNRALFDVLTRAYDGAHFVEMFDRTDPPLERLLARAKAAGAVRADIEVTDFAPILEMLSALTGSDISGAPYLPHRYIDLVLAGLRPSAEPLTGQPPARDQLREAVAGKAGILRRQRRGCGTRSDPLIDC